MKRTIEPELMIDPAQVQSYFENDRSQIKHLFKVAYQTVKTTAPATMADLGCGPGDLTSEMALFHPTSLITGIDNSSEMLALAKSTEFVKFKQMPITEVSEYYDRVISSLTLHHFHNPMDFWATIKRIAPKDVFILDFIRPESEEELAEIIKHREPYLDDLFRIDFENSLRACFTIEELKQQIADAGLNLDVHEVDQFHLRAGVVIIAGVV